jgi:hypothetical protein
MRPTEMLVHEHSLELFFDRLRVETDPQRRAALRYWAIAEEDRYGELQARIDKVDGWVRDGDARIVRQRQLVGRYEAECAHRDAAQTLLTNLEELQQLLVTFQSALHDIEQ